MRSSSHLTYALFNFDINIIISRSLFRRTEDPEERLHHSTEYEHSETYSKMVLVLRVMWVICIMHDQVASN